MLKNIVFANGYLKKSSDHGSAINWIGNGGILDNCTFKDNKNEWGRGSLFLGADNVIVRNCTFKDNTADTAGTIYWNEAYGVLNNSLFVNNFADGIGAAVVWSGMNNTAYEGIITNCTFENNSGDGNGGSIAMFNENGVIENCTFKNNYAKKCGGAFYSGGRNNVLINNSYFLNNSAKSGGGAVCWDSGWYCKIVNSTFINNSATNSGGGAISWKKENGTVLNCTFINTNASFTGGAIYWVSTGGLVDLCNFINNSNTRDGGAIYWSKCSNCTLNNSFFENNAAKIDGDAIYYLSSKCILNNCTFKDNSVFIDSGNINITNSNFTISNATCAIYNEGTLYLNNNTLNKNSSILNNANITSKVNVKVLNASYIIIPLSKTILNATICDDNNNSIGGDKFTFIINDNEIDADYNENILSAEYDFDNSGLYNISLNCSCFNDYTLLNASIYAYNPDEVMNVNVCDIHYMENASINFSLPDDARGNITLMVGDNSYTITLNETVKGSFKFNIENLGAGVYKVFANYSGDDNYISKKIETVLIVNKADPTLTITSDDITVGETAQININLSTQGNVTLFVADKNYTSNESIVYISNLSVAKYYVFASFEGNDNYTKTSNVTSFNVLKKPINLTVNIADKINIYCDSNATGNLLVEINGTTYYASLLDGKSNVSIPHNLSNGSYNVVVKYLGNDEYSSNSTTAVLNIERNKGKILSIDASPVFEGTQSLIIVNMNGDESGLIIFEVNNVNYTSMISDKQSKLYITLPAGINNVNVYYEGDSKYDSADAMSGNVIVNPKMNSNLTIDDVVFDIAGNVTFYASINGVNCSDVIFMVNGVVAEGITNVSAGSYIVSAVFYGNSSNNPNSTSKTFNVKKINTIIDVASSLTSSAVDLSAESLKIHLCCFKR